MRRWRLFCRLFVCIFSPVEVSKLKLFKTLLIAALAAAPFAVAQAADVKIGFVSVAKILQNAPQAESASKRLEQEFAPRQKALVEAQKSLRKQEEKLSKDSAVMGDSQRRSLESDIRNQARELKRTGDEFREDFNLRRNEELGKFQKQVLEVINNIAKEDGFDLVVNDGAALYASPQVDVTEKVLKRLTSK
ncbi:MAG: OmpH family outer membrane protein [Candidatus Competibacteraceae bacterium]|nr:OmpH family outer membrane protein [Candidatus Competibacteraceae bacterium]